MLTLRTLGELQLLSGPDAVAISRVREMAFLTYLACNGERTLTRAHLAAMFWPHSNQAHGLHSLSQAMYRLTRRARGLSFGGDSRVIAVDPRTLEVDLAQFRRHLQGREFVLARALYRAPFLDGFDLEDAPEFDAWLEQTRREVALAAEDMFRAILGAAETTGDWTQAEDAARQLSALDPYDEAAAATEIALLVARGERARAAERQREAEFALQSIGRTPSRRLLDALGAVEHDGGRSEATLEVRLPLIGRAVEFEELKRLLARAQRGDGGAIVVTGKAGIGKTRLCRQFRRLAAIRGFRALTAAGAPLLRATPYAATRELLSSFSQGELARLCPEWLDVLAAVLPQQRATTEVRAAGEPVPRDWIYGAVSSLLNAAAGEAPLLILCDDIQWIDAATLDLIRFLVKRGETMPWLLVTTARANEVEGESALALLHSLERLNLTELAPDAVQEFIDAFCAAAGTVIPPADADRIRGAAAGHPFFLLELLRRWERDTSAHGPRKKVVTNDSVDVFLASQLGFASATARSVAEALAVLGGSCDPETVAAVAGVESSVMTYAVDELSGAGLLLPGARLGFVHDLVREAAYERLSPLRRQMLHARAARALRNVRGVDVGTLALHSDLGNVHDLAHKYAVAAATVMERRLGYEEAESHWRLAVRHAPTARARLNAEERLADCVYRLKKSTGEANRLYTELLETPRLPPAKRLVARARQASIQCRLGRFDDALALFPELVDVAERLGDRSASLAVAEAVAFGAAAVGGEALIERFLPFLCRTIETLPDTADKLSAVLFAIHLLAFRADAERLERYFAVALRCASNTGPVRRADVQGVRAIVAALGGQPVSADMEFAEALHIVGGDIGRIPWALRANWGVVKLELGHFDEAAAHLHATARWGQETDSGYQRRMAEANLGLVAFERGDWELARRHCELALSSADAGVLAAGTVQAYGILGMISLRGDPDRAGDYRQVLLAAPDRERAGGDLSYAEIFLARMDDKVGRGDLALERLDRGIRSYANRDFFVHARLELEKARLIGLTDRDAGLKLARAVRARALDAGAVLLLNQSEELIRQLKRGAAPAAGDSADQKGSQGTSRRGAGKTHRR